MPDFCDCGAELVALYFEDPEFGGTMEIDSQYCIECNVVID